MSQENLESQVLPQESDGVADESSAQAKLVPVGESIKYRRRAQQAESRVQEIEQQLTDLQTQVRSRDEQLATLQAQRDEAQQTLIETTNRAAATVMLTRAGAVDADAASILLAQRVDFTKPLDEKSLAGSVQTLLSDKPFLRAKVAAAALPSPTATARTRTSPSAARLTTTAAKATHSGDRRDVAEYLRLRRAAALK